VCRLEKSETIQATAVTEQRTRFSSLFAYAFKTYVGLCTVPTAANREPAFATYSRRDANTPRTAHSIHVLTLEQEAISRLTLFDKPDGPRLFDAFGLPSVLPD